MHILSQTMIYTLSRFYDRAKRVGTYGTIDAIAHDQFQNLIQNSGF